MEKAATPAINLAKNRGETFTDRFLAFALTIGRALVIVTEAIALGAFLFRFGLDRQILDLHDKITQEQAVIKLLKSNETTYRNLQDRLSLANTLDTQEAASIKIVTDITSFIPAEMDVTTLTFTTTTIRVEGSAPSILSLSAFVKKLKTYPQVTSVSLDKIENKSTEGSISFSVTAFLKVPKGQKINS